MASSIEQYKFTLDKKAEQNAEQELNEVPTERLGALKSFHDWVVDQQYWLKCPTDAKLLLSFLRTAKFAQLKARERLINFWTKRSQHPYWFKNIYTKEDNVLKILRSGLFLILPGRDADGRKILFCRWGKIDASGNTFTSCEYMAASLAFLDFVILNEEAQVNGVIFLNDVGDVTLKHQTFLGIDSIPKLSALFFKSSPLRYKELHFYDTGPVFEAMFVLVKSMMPTKVAQRVTFHGNNMTAVYERIDKSLLPKEYLPDEYAGKCAGSIDQIAENMVKELQKPEYRDIITRMSSECISIDLTNKPEDVELLGESFRMLNQHD